MERGHVWPRARLPELAAALQQALKLGDGEGQLTVLGQLQILYDALRLHQRGMSSLALARQ